MLVACGKPPGPGTPVCATDGGGLQVIDVPAFGSFQGDGLNGAFCSGGAFVQLERAPSGQVLFSAFDTSSNDLSSVVHITEPANATLVYLLSFAGALTAAPGTYSSGSTCGALTLCVMLPAPTGVDCGNAAPTCPAGCQISGPVSAPTCTPIVPQKCWVAQAASDCLGGTQEVVGSWSLALTSVTPLPADASVNPYFVVHGVFDANLVSDDDAKTSATLTLGF